MKNPVATADSIDALDLLSRVLPVLHQAGAPLSLIAEIKEQKLRHQRALVSIIGDEPIEED